MPQLIPVDHDPFEVQAPDGSIVQFPGGTDFNTVHSVMSQHFGGRQLIPVDHEQPSTAEDVAKSAGIGMAKGAIGIPGLPGDLAAALPHAADWLRGKAVQYGLMTQEASEADRAREAAKGMRDIPLPTSADIRGGIEQRTGPFYEPQTRAGRYAQSAAEFVPGSLVGGGGVVKNALRYGVAPGLASEAAGEATQGTGLETWARVGAALGVGGIGGLITQPRTAERFIRAQLPEYVDEAAVNSAQSLIKDANRQGVRLTWPEALSQVTGRPVLNDVQRILEGSKQTRSTMQQAIGDRPAEIAGAGENVATGIAPGNAQPSTIGPQIGAAAESSINDVRGNINQATDPLYKSAASVRLTPQEMQQVYALPGWDEASKAVRSNPQLERYVAGLPDNSVGFLNEVKKYLDQAAENARGTPAQNRNMQVSAGYGSDAAAVRGVGVNASLDYASALGQQAYYRETFLDPLLQGPLGRLADKDITTQNAINALFPDRPLPGTDTEVSKTITALARKNPDAARQLVRAHVESKLEEAFNAAGRNPETSAFSGAEFAKRITGNPLIETARAENFKAAVQALPNGQQLWPGIERFLDIVKATGWRQPIGSKTAFNEAELHGMATGQAIGNIVKTAAAPGEWWHWAHERWGKWQTGDNLALLAKIITDPRSAGVFKKLASMSPRQVEPRAALDAAARITFAVGAGSTVPDRVVPKQPLRIRVPVPYRAAGAP